MHTHQETFDMSGLALIAQGRPGFDDEQRICRYSLGCAAAQLLPPEIDREKLDDNWSGTSATVSGIREHFEAAGFDVVFVRALQNAHDRAAYRGWHKHWLPELVVVAAVRKVSPNRVLQAARDAGWADVPADVEGA
jgi:hypothetical protein